MTRWLCLTAVALMVLGAPVQAGEITGQYIEARTCEVFTGPCFSNADTNLTGKHAVLAWKIERGTFDQVALDGLGVVAVVAASETLGMPQTGPTRSLLIVDEKANVAQREALVRLARQQTGDLLRNVVAIEAAPIELTICACQQNACALLKAGSARIETRCIDAKHDKACGNDAALFPPLASHVQQPRAAVAVEHSYTGKGFNETWKDHGQRSAYVGAFVIR